MNTKNMARLRNSCAQGATWAWLCRLGCAVRRDENRRDIKLNHHTSIKLPRPTGYIRTRGAVAHGQGTVQAGLRASAENFNGKNAERGRGCTARRGMRMPEL